MPRDAPFVPGGGPADGIIRSVTTPPLAVQLSTFPGALVLLGTAWGLARPRHRRRAIAVGCIGMLAGALAALAYTLTRMAAGIDLDSIPHEPAAQWFVAAFGWAGAAAFAAIAVLPPLRARVDGPPLAPNVPREVARPRAVAGDR
jgi:hypothetical protein